MPGLVLTPRTRIMGLALAAGLAAGAAAWAVLGSGAADQQRLAADQAELGKLKAPGRPPSILGALVADAIAHPIFTLTTGPGAQTEPVIRVSGLSRTPVHRAALVSVNGGNAEWLDVGETSAGVTLLDVDGSKAVVETAFGRKEVDVGAPGPSPSPPGAPLALHPADPVPAGSHLPPAPASASVAP